MVSSQLCTRPIHSALPSRSRGRTAAQRGKLARHDSTANAARFSDKKTRSSYGKCRAQLRTRRQCPNRRISHFATRGQNGDHMPLADSDTTMRPTGPRTSMEYFVPATKKVPSQLRTRDHGPATRTLARYPRHANITACYSPFSRCLDAHAYRCPVPPRPQGRPRDLARGRTGSRRYHPPQAGPRRPHPEDASTTSSTSPSWPRTWLPFAQQRPARPPRLHHPQLLRRPDSPASRLGDSRLCHPRDDGPLPRLREHPAHGHPPDGGALSATRRSGSPTTYAPSTSTPASRTSA